MNLFRELTEQEEQTFRQWARENYEPYFEIKGIWHWVIQDECVKINKEANLNPLFLIK